MEIWSILSADAVQNLQGPLAARLQYLLNDAIQKGVLGPGYALPSERLIADRTGVSRVTVRRALTSLVREGVLVSIRGSGSYVSSAAHIVDDQCVRDTSVCHLADLQPEATLSECVSFSIHEASAEEMISLGIPSGKVLRTIFVVCRRLERVAVSHRTIPLDLMPPLGVSRSAVEVAFERLQADSVRTIKRIYASFITGEDAELLDVQNGSLGLALHNISYLANGKPCIFTKDVHRADICEFLIEQHFVDRPGPRPEITGNRSRRSHTETFDRTQKYA